MNDVNPQRSIRNVPVSNRRRTPGPDPEFVHTQGVYRLPPDERPPRSFFWLWAGGAVILCAGIGAALSMLFTGATVAVTPRTATVTPAAPIAASNSCAEEGNCAETSVRFEQIAVAASTSRTVAASGSQNISVEAQGTITIFNNHSTSPQTLVATTRFESPTGHIYRIREDVTVPGGKKKADGSLEPGSVRVLAYADKAGASYNTGATQLSIPGFKGGPKYNGFYATTEGISGGASGLQPAVPAAESAKVRTDMQAELKNILSSRLVSQVPDGFVLIPNSTHITYSDVMSQDSPAAGASAAGKATLGMSAQAAAQIVEINALASAVAYASVEGYDGTTVSFVDADRLQMQVPDMLQEGTDGFNITVEGPVTLVWKIDEAAIIETIAGKNKSQFDALMEQFKPAVASASASLRPFWLSSFPSDPAKIKIKIKRE